MRPPRTHRGALACASLLVALLSAAGLRAPAEQLPVRPYTISDGLAHDEVLHIFQDSHGFLWFGAVDGLSRFDGYRFTNYGTKDGLPSSYVNDIIQTRAGAYWVATNEGVSRLNPSAGARTSGALFKNYPIGDELQSSLVSGLYEDSRGQLWAATQGGLFRLEGGEGGAFRRVPVEISVRSDRVLEVRTLIEDRGGSLWLATGQGLVRRMPDGRTVHYPLRQSESTDFVWSLMSDAQGRLWAGTQSGLLVFVPGEPGAAATNNTLALPERPEEEEAGAASPPARPFGLPSTPGSALWLTTADGLAHNTVHALRQTSDGRVWIGTRGGLTLFDGARFRSYTAAEGLSNRINAVEEDRDGNLWVGTQTRGALKVARSGLVSYRDVDGLGHPEVVSIFQDLDGALIAVTGKWMLNRLDGERFTAVQPNLPPRVLEASGVRWDVIQDHAGEWWMATARGLYRFPRVARLEDLATAAPVAVYTTREGLADNYISRLFEDSRGDIWISSFNPPVMLTRWERATGTLHRYDDRDGLPPFNWANVFAEDRSGTLWIGLHNGGLARLRPGAARFEVFGAAEGVPEGLGQGLYFDRAGRLWVATRGKGTGRIDDPSAERPRAAPFAAPGELASENLRCFAEDDWGNVYIGTARGIDRINPSTGQVKHFTTTDGLVKSEVVRAFRDRAGALWFGTREGLSRLLPEPDRPHAPPPVLIGGMRVAGVPRPVSELGEAELAGLVLEAGENQIDIDFFGLAFSAGETLRYQYMFEGSDRDWSAPTDQRTVTATLSPGSYRFLVRAVNADGLVSEAPAVVSFRILRPVWQRWWFVTGVVLLASALAYALYRYRVAQLLQVERVRTRIATDLHDDIGASLSRMAILSEVVKTQMSGTGPLGGPRGTGGLGAPRPRPSAALLSEIADSARGLVDSMSDIVWSIDPRKDDLRSVIQRVRQFASDVLEPRGIVWDFTVPEEVEALKVNPDTRRHLFLILKEAVNNVARHAGGARHVLITLRAEGRQLVGQVSDDGPGFTPKSNGDAPARTRGGNGLPNMRARAAEIGGRLEVESAPGSGTRLTLRVPMK